MENKKIGPSVPPLAALTEQSFKYEKYARAASVSPIPSITR